MKDLIKDGLDHCFGRVLRAEVWKNELLRHPFTRPKLVGKLLCGLWSTHIHQVMPFQEALALEIHKSINP